MIPDAFSQITPDTKLKEVLEELLSLSGKICPPGTPLEMIIHRSEMIYRSLRMIRLMKKQMWIGRTLNKHAAVLETMNCRVANNGPVQNETCECDCVCDCAEEDLSILSLFKPPPGVGPQ